MRIHILPSYGAFIDDQDYESVDVYEWSLIKKNDGSYYAATVLSNGTEMTLHDFVASLHYSTEQPYTVKHIDGYTLNCFSSNLEVKYKRTKKKTSENTQDPSLIEG